MLSNLSLALPAIVNNSVRYIGIAGLLCCGLTGCDQAAPNGKTSEAALCEWRVDPPHWWAGLCEEPVMLLVDLPKGTVLNHVEVAPPYEVASWEQAPDGPYAFVHLQSNGALREAPEPCVLSFLVDSTRWDRVFDVRANAGANKPLGEMTASSAMYLLMPDRFSNGDARNDDVEGMRERGTDRDQMYARHGGDLRGVREHLDHVKALGFSAIWMNPVVENDMTEASYHGYSATDLYRIDPRLGDWAAYERLVDEAHNKGMHIIHDWVPNHWGVHHRLFESPPDRNWFHPELQTNYRGATLMDPHAFEVEKTGFTDGWFVPSMPDLNQQSQTLSNYLITNALWLIAETGLDGFRIDTYTYADQGFMREFNERIKAANPQSFLFGEAWVYSAAMQAELINETGLDGICDFGTGFSFHEGLNEEEGWTKGLSRLYLNWSQDFLYDDPNFLVTFLDNHDMDRWRGRTPNDSDARMGYALLLLGRGIPCVYYGSEWGWSSLSRPDGLVREDAFEALANPPEVENAWHELIRKLTTFRTEHPKLFAADFKHSIPKDGVYVQWRKAEEEGNGEALFLLCNRGTEARADVWDRVPTGWSQGRDVMNGEALQRGESLEVQAGDFLAIYLTR